MILFCFRIFGLSGQKQYLCKINTFRPMIENFDINSVFEGGGMPSLEMINDYIKKGRELPTETLSEDIAHYLEKMREQWANNDYVKSVKVYITQEGVIILAGDDDRSFKLSNYAVIIGRDIYCWAGNVLFKEDGQEDGHLNVFINNTDGMIPNCRYHLGNITYQTDCYGRVIAVSEDYTKKMKFERRSGRGVLKTISNQKDGRDSDIGGHIVAHNINGASEAINIVAMDRDFNNGGEWKWMENEIHSAYTAQKLRYVHRLLEYKESSKRPSRNYVQYDIDGHITSKSFDLP